MVMEYKFHNLFIAKTSGKGEKKISGVPPDSTVSQTPAFQGDLSQIALSDLAQLLDLAQLTGVLEVITSNNAGIFYFDNGNLVFGLLESNQERVGQRLLKERIITPEQLDECLEEHRDNNGQEKLGNILIRKGYLQPNMLTEALATQIREAFFETLTWNRGSFLFHSNKKPMEQNMLLNERINSLLLQSMVRLDSKNA
ncbi:MAG: hypothetical protein CSA32_00425 [Desulfobulbus propionicus]|nr:MAG: hypothetical protein CSA32_00425 [Desulfobulbus propionicus]